MALDRIRMITGDNANATGGDPEEIPPAAHVYRLADAVGTGDPKSIENTAPVAVGNDGEYIRFAIDTPGTATVPNSTDIGGTYVEFLAKDLLGETVTIMQGDIARIWLWLGGLTGLLATDTYVAVAFTAGGVGAIGNGGVVVGMRYSASGNEAFVQGNVGAGAGWTAVLAGTAVDALTRGVQYVLLKNNSQSSVFRNVIPIDASGHESQTAGSSPTAPSANTYTDSPMTHIAVLAGWSGAGGSGTQVLDVSVRSFLAKLGQLEDSLPDLAPVTPAEVDPPLRFLLIGDSNGNSTTVDGTWASAAVQSGWTYRHNGTNNANYPASTNPGVGAVPYLIGLAIGRGAVSGTRWVARRTTNGADTGFPGTIAGQLSGAFADVAALGGGDPHIVCWIFGANDSNDATEAALYLNNMRRAMRIARRQWPSAIFVLWKERTTDTGTYPQLATTIYGHIDTLAAEFPGTVIADSSTGTPAPLFDAIHFSTSPGGGQDVMAQRTIAAVYA